MTTWQPDLTPLFSRIPRLFFLLKAVGDSLHADLGVTTAMRGVMTSLATSGPRTVPDLARDRPVSRQHIQVVVNALFAEGLAKTERNPVHRRSPLIDLTDEGMRRLRLIQEREAALMAKTAPAVSQADLAAAVRLFDLLEHDLSARVRETEPTTEDFRGRAENGRIVGLTARRG
jgi:DNA-binding MarR family transcriptional regulator